MKTKILVGPKTETFSVRAPDFPYLMKDTFALYKWQAISWPFLFDRQFIKG
jgi:hypothetical protein